MPAPGPSTSSEGGRPSRGVSTTRTRPPPCATRGGRRTAAATSNKGTRGVTRYDDGRPVHSPKTVWTFHFPFPFYQGLALCVFSQGLAHMFHLITNRTLFTANRLGKSFGRIRFPLDASPFKYYRYVYVYVRIQLAHRRVGCYILSGYEWIYRDNVLHLWLYISFCTAYVCPP